MGGSPRYLQTWCQKQACCLMGPAVLSGQYLQWETTNGFPPGWVFLVFVCPPLPAEYLCRGSDRSDSGHGNTEGFPRCLTYPGIIYVAEVTTDTPHRYTLEMQSCPVSIVSKDWTHKVALFCIGTLNKIIYHWAQTPYFAINKDNNNYNADRFSIASFCCRKIERSVGKFCGMFYQLLHNDMDSK